MSKNPTNPNNGNKPNEDNKINKIQNNIDDTTGLMRENIDKLLQRGDNIDNLRDKTEDLQKGSKDFYITTRTVKRQMWWKNMKMKLIIAGIILFVIAMIAIAIAVAVKT